MFKPDHASVLRRRWSVAAAFALLLATVMTSFAASVIYDYDDAGRLKKATFDDGTVVIYNLDPAGNRSAVQMTITATAPTSLTVPLTSNTGSYSISWPNSATATVTGYKLWEANNSAFTGETLAFSGQSPASITGKANGVYYYRVQACEGTLCGGYRVGSNAVTVVLPPGAPATITVPGSVAAGSYSISWTAPASGNVTGYELYESGNSSYSPQSLVYNGSSTNTTRSNSNATLYYRVRACNGAGNCGGYTAGGPLLVAPAIPAAINVPASSSGSIALSWNTVSGPITAYEVYEATNSAFTGQTVVYSNTGSGTTLTRGNGTYYYRVRACNGANCSGYRAGATFATVIVPPNAPPGISVPAASSGAHTISWTAGSDTWQNFELYESTSASFATQTAVYTSNGTSTSLTGRSDGTYYYRVRACYQGACGGYATGANGTLVTNLPGIPPTISVPSSASSTYFVTWGGSTGVVSSYEVQESRNDPTFGGVLAGGPSSDTSYTVNPNLEGSYYYRVRACNVSGCSGWRTGGTPTVVIFPPGAPSSMNVPVSTTNGAYSISWGSASGTSPNYEVYEANNPSFTSEVSVYSGTGSSLAFSNKPSATYYYRVRACNSAGCSGFTAGANGIVSAWPPGVVSSMLMPNGFAGASFTIYWGLAGGQVTSYELYEATNSSFSGEVLVHSGSSPATLSRGNGVYYYRVRACNTFPGNCGPPLAGNVPVTVVLAPSAPASITVPPTSSGSHTVSWTAPSSGTYDSYSLYESLSAGWESWNVAYSGPNTSANLTGRATGTYYYRVLASNQGVTSGYTTGSNPTVVNTPPPIPGVPQSLRRSPTTGNGRTYTILWNAVTTGAPVNHYTLTETETGTVPPSVVTYNIAAATTSKAFSWPEGTFAQLTYTVRACATANESACSAESNGVFKQVCPTSGCP